MGFMDRMKQAAESAQAATSKVGVGASADQMALANRAQKLNREGVDTPATINEMTPTGNTDKPGGAENIIKLTARPAGADAYDVEINQYIYPSAPFAVGDEVNLKVAPDDPGEAMIYGKL